MLKMSIRGGLALALMGGLLVSAGAAPADDRTPEKVLAEIDAVALPKVPANTQDRAAVQAFLADRQKAMEQKAALIGELYKIAPERDELTKLLPTRWQVQMMTPGKADAANAEIAEIIAKNKNPKLVAEAEFMNVVKVFRDGGRTPDAVKLGAAIEVFAKKFPKDDRGAKLLMALADMTDDEAKKSVILKRVEKDYPDSPAIKALAGTRRQKEGVGKPFEIAFVDAIKGSQVSSQTLMGKVVVVDFWATWCGPCIAEMPKMKDLYAKYKDKGVEFVGVSLDSPKEDGGYDKLKEYVEKNKIEWPQYYMGKGWESDFSMGWGINSIPCVFLVDAEGKLATVEARGKLEELIPEYLEKAKKARPAVTAAP